MALTLPDPEELDQFTLGASEIFSEDAKFMAIEQAGDLLYAATSVTESPTEPPQLVRIFKWGILDMAFKILITQENKTEIYAPFSSETIGSYSYSKQALAAIQAGLATGVEWFDILIRMLNGLSGTTSVSVSSEHVFTEPYCEADLRQIYRPDVYGW